MTENQSILRDLTYNAASAVQAILAGDLQLAIDHLRDEQERLGPCKAVTVASPPPRSTPIDLTGLDLPEWVNFVAMDGDKELRWFSHRPDVYNDFVWNRCEDDESNRDGKDSLTGILIRNQPNVIPALSLTPVVRQPKPHQFDIAPFADKIPAAARWVAMDANGEIHACDIPPMKYKTFWVRPAIDIFYNDGAIARIDPTGIDWTTTLTPVNR